MEPVEGARSFLTSGDAYDSFMGRYSRALAGPFAEWSGVISGISALDVGCGPGALTEILIDRLGIGAVAAFDPSPPFVSECARRHPGIDVRVGRAEAIPFDDDSFDCALAQLVLHFVTDPEAAAHELRRVVRPGGVVAACVWDVTHGMELLRHFWDAALAVDPEAPDEARTRRFGREGEIVDLLIGAGFANVEESKLTVRSTYATFDELWSSFQAGIGPAGEFCASLAEDRRAAVRGEMFRRVGSPRGAFSLAATAHCARGTVPDGTAGT